MADQGGDQAEVGVVAGGEDEAVFLAEKLGEGGLELLVQVERAVQEPAAGAAGAVAVQGAGGRLEHLGVVGQAEVVVGPEHDPLLAFDDDHGVFRLRDRLEVRIEPRRLDLIGLGELPALVEQRDVLKGLSGHETSGGAEWSGGSPPITM